METATKDPVNQANQVFSGLGGFFNINLEKEPQKCYRLFHLCSGFCGFLFAAFVACTLLPFGQNKTFYDFTSKCVESVCCRIIYCAALK